jgi:hypothetical protein
MAHVHYEAAFEDYLRTRQAPYIAVDETHRALFSGVKLKSFDFLVYASSGDTLIVDVKGRRLPISGARSRSPQNWVTREDAESLGRWQEVFGTGFTAVFMFAYWLDGPPPPGDTGVHGYEGGFYRFTGIRLEDYVRHARVRSTRWQTLTLPAGIFRENSRPAAVFL